MKKTLEELIAIITDAGIGVDQYKEDGVLCGYELNAHTNGGLNEILFLDFRDKDLSATDPADFVEEFESYLKDYDVDERVESNRNDPSYKAAFTLKQSLKDIGKFKKKLKGLLAEMKGEK